MIRYYGMVYCFLFLGLFTASAQQAAEQATVAVQGEVQHPLTLGVADLAKMKRVEATVKDRGGDTHVYSGVALPEILSRAGATMGRDLRGENMTKYLLVKSGDGYSVVFTLA